VLLPTPISRTSIGDVPVFFVEGPGPIRAALIFRVGRVDESLPIAGYTHLVEHLALFPFRNQSYGYGGTVEGLRTVFPVSGTAEQVARHFDQLTVSLRRLPLDRLWTEARILRTEAASRKIGPVDWLLRLRFGPRHWGVLCDEERGLNTPSHIAVQQWADRWFTAGNAALWISGNDLPPITLDLPAGPRIEVPELPRTTLPLPAWLSVPLGGVALSMIAPPSSSLLLLQRLIARRARTRLRDEEGVSYDVTTGYQRLSRDLGHLGVWADALPEFAESVTNGLLQVIDELASTGPDEDELLTEIAQMTSSLEHPGAMLTFLDAAVPHELMGSEHTDPGQMARELQAATSLEMTKLLATSWGTAIALVPPHVKISERGFKPVSASYRSWITVRP